MAMTKKRELTSTQIFSLILGVFMGLLPMTGPKAADTPSLPPSTKAVIHFDLERLRESDLYTTAEEHIGVLARSNERLQLFLGATGLDDAASSLKAFTIYSFADETTPQAFAGVLSGDFGSEAVQQLEKAYSPVAWEAKGHVIMPFLQTPEFELVMSFLGPDKLAFGTAPSVEKVVSTQTPSADLLAAYKRTVTRRPIWGLIDAAEAFDILFSQEIGSGGNAPLEMLKQNQAVRSLQSIGFSIDLGTDLFFEMRALTADPESARLMAEAVKGAVALAQMGASQTTDADILDFFRQIVAENERDSLYVSFAVTKSQIERLKAGEDLIPNLIP